MDEYYPEWLGKDIIAGTLPWDRALITTLPAFLQQYSFHDSYWIGLYLEANRNGLMIIRWDTFWTEGKVPFPGPTIAEWPLLVVRFSRLQQVDIALLEDGIAGASSSPLTGQEMQSLSETEDLHRTQIDDHSGGRAQLVHDLIIEILCLSREREVLEIPFIES